MRPDMHMVENLPAGGAPNRWDHRDYDFLKSKKLGSLPTFPDNYCTDVGLWNPNQNEGCSLFTPPVPPMPFGCTNYAQTDLLIDEDQKLYNPMELEAITHANANGGTDLRTSLKALVKLHPNHPQFFNVQPDINRGGMIDWFDAIRVAMIIGKPENRAVSVGSPWFPGFMHPINGVVSETNWNTTIIGTSLSRISWHDWNVKGWKMIDSQVYLIMKPWIGTGWADSGFGYISRTNFNRFMSIPGTVAYTLDKLLPGETPEKIDSTVAQWLVSFFTNLFK